MYPQVSMKFHKILEKLCPVFTEQIQTVLIKNPDESHCACIRKRLIEIDVTRYFDTNCDASFKFTSPLLLIHVVNLGKNRGLLL